MDGPTNSREKIGRGVERDWARTFDAAHKQEAVRPVMNISALALFAQLARTLSHDSGGAGRVGEYIFVG